MSWDPNEPFINDANIQGLFCLASNATLELDRIILDGKNVPVGNNLALVYLSSNGTLRIKEGTKITNFVSTDFSNTNVYGAVIGGGNTGATGTLIMEGGEISGNRCERYHITAGTFEMAGGAIRNNNSDSPWVWPYTDEGINLSPYSYELVQYGP